MFSSSGREIWRSEKLAGMVESVYWSPDGTKIAIGGAFNRVIVLSLLGGFGTSMEESTTTTRSHRITTSSRTVVTVTRTVSIVKGTVTTPAYKPWSSLMTTSLGNSGLFIGSPGLGLLLLVGVIAAAIGGVVAVITMTLVRGKRREPS